MKKNVNINPPLSMSEALGKMCKSMQKNSKEKGVHSNIIHEDQASEKGISDAGRNVRNAQKQNEKGQYNTAVSANQTAARFHHKTLNELKAMPKPKLTRSELEKFDQDLKKSWGKAEGAPAPASMPTPPAPKMKQPKMPTMKAPGAKSPSMKAPAMKMPKMEMMEKGVKVNMPLGPKGSGAGSITVSDDKNKKMSLVGAPVMKDDKPHAPGSPEERSHAVVEQGVSLPKAMKQVQRGGHEALHRFFNHLRTLNDTAKRRSPENVMKSGDEPGKKYVTVSQHWASGIHDKASGKYANPVKDAGKSRPEHMDDLHALKAKGHISSWGEHDKPVKHWGSETYEKHPDGKLKFVHADYDTSD